MPKLELENPNIKLQLVYSRAVSLADGLLAELWRSLRALNLAVRLTSLECTQLQGELYVYSIMTKDGRAWHQTLRFDRPGDPGMTFDVEDAWRLTELEPHRTLRLLLVRLFQEYGMTSFEVEWHD